jgi:hypothetical protein
MRGTGAALAVTASVMLAACGNTATPSTGTTPTATASVVRLTTAQKAQVQTILSGNLTHYQGALTAGKQALGTTQYADGQAGLQAMNDPNSNASKFRDWRHSSGVEQDVSYLDASKAVNAIYTADNQPDVLTTTEQDLSTVQADISAWVSVAVGWQIHTKTSAELASAEQTVNADVATVQKDITALFAAS